jgi:replication-associated recombination protein RarA
LYWSSGQVIHTTNLQSPHPVYQLWGPLGTVKTTLAMTIANQTKSHFETLLSVLAGDSKERDSAERRKLYGKRTNLFVKQVVEPLNPL